MTKAGKKLKYSIYYRLYAGIHMFHAMQILMGIKKMNEYNKRIEEALEHDAAASKRFATFSPGKKRSVASYITQAKREETRMKRAYEIAHKLSSYTLHGDISTES